MFDMFKRSKNADSQARLGMNEKSKKREETWSLRYPETKYDKYIKEHRSISESKRGNAWFELSGGREMRDECGKDYYKGVVALSQKDTTSRDAIQIEKDLARTVIKGRTNLTEMETNNLREVLKAVSYELRLEGGYCQSMNFIAALLLCHMENELAFYTQVCINRLLFSNYFTDELFGMRVDEKIFSFILTEKLPELADHFDICDISLTHLTFHWFLCLFINVLPIEVTEYIWDRVFYFGSHVIHAAALQILKNNQKLLLKKDDLEDIVVFLTERLNEATIADFKGMETLGISLSRIRILRVDYAAEVKKEEDELKKQVKHTQELEKQSSLRMSVRSLRTSEEAEKAEYELTLEVVEKMKGVIVNYVIQHCASSRGVAVAKCTSRMIRDYCEAGFSEEEFLSLWNVVKRAGILPPNSETLCTELFNEYKMKSKGEVIVDIRRLLTGLMPCVSGKVSIPARLQYYFSVYDMKNEGVILRSAFTDFITAVYVNCDEVVDPQRAADKYVKIVFAVNTQSPDVITFQEFRSLVLIQPQILSYLELIDLSDEEVESISPPSLDAESEELRPNSAIIDLHELHPLLAQHPFVVQATRLPVSQQSALKAFLQDMDCIVRERDELKKELTSSNSRSSYRDSLQKSIRLSSNRLLGTSKQKSIMGSRSPMERILEEDEGSSAAPPMKVMTRSDAGITVRRRIEL